MQVQFEFDLCVFKSKECIMPRKKKIIQQLESKIQNLQASYQDALRMNSSLNFQVQQIVQEKEHYKKKYKTLVGKYNRLLTLYLDLGGDEHETRKAVRGNLEEEIASLKQEHYVLVQNFERAQEQLQKDYDEKLKKIAIDSLREEQLAEQRVKDVVALSWQIEEQKKEKALNDLQIAIKARSETNKELEKSTESLQKEIDNLSTYLHGIRDERDLIDAGLHDFDNPADASMQFKYELDEVKKEYKQLIKDKEAVVTRSKFSFNGSEKLGEKFISDMAKLALRSYNAEVENSIYKAKAGNLQVAYNRLEKCKNQIEKASELINLRLTERYVHLREREIELTVAFLDAKKLAKEEERERNAYLREIEKEERELQRQVEKEKDKLRKERSHIVKVLKELESQDREDELEEYEDLLEEIEQGIEDLDTRKANTKAGYVYVISNVGSFGEGVVKIGMTRRLNPMDRVKELSDASVPFNFDVHLLHFSEDAVGVENALHRKFSQQRLNLVNFRREFFRVSPHEVREALFEIDGSVLEFDESVESFEFERSEAMREAGVIPVRGADVSDVLNSLDFVG